MLHGLELAQRIAAHLENANVAEQVLVLQMPGWASRTPTVPFGIAVVRGPLFHILAAVEVWKIIVAPPPVLARFSRRFEWSSGGAREEGGPDAPAIERALAELAVAWWAEAPEAVGTFDVAGAVTQALTSALGVARGAFGNITYTESGRDGAERFARCGVGREGTSARWPELANVMAQPAGISLTLTTSTGARENSQLRTVPELAAALPSIVATLRATDEACAAWLTRLDALQDTMSLLGARLPGVWTTTYPFEISLGTPPLVVLSAAAEIGGTVGVHVKARGAGVTISVGDDSFEAARPAEVPALIARLIEAVAVESRIMRASRLTAGERYGVIRAFAGAEPGDVVRFRELTEIKPSGADAWFFTREAAKPSTVTLTSDDPADVAVLDSLWEFLAPITARR